MDNFNLMSNRLRWAVTEKEKRDSRKITQTELAEVAKVTRASVTYWMQSGGISSHAARLIAEFLNVDAIWLETGQGKPNIPYPATSSKNSLIVQESTKTSLDYLLHADAAAGLEEMLIKFFRGSKGQDRELLLSIANRFYSYNNPDDKSADPFKSKRKARSAK